MYVRVNVNVLHTCTAHLFWKHKTRKMQKIQNCSVIIKEKKTIILYYFKKIHVEIGI